MECLYHVSDVRPPSAERLQETEAFGEPFLGLVPEDWLLDETVLKVDRSHNDDTVTYNRVTYLEAFMLDEIYQMENPAGADGNILKGLSNKRLRHNVPKVSKPHG